MRYFPDPKEVSVHSRVVDDDSKDTRSGAYAERLRRKEQAPWKQLLHVQAPYRWNLRRQHLGRTLDVGCGIGRNLEALPGGSIGVDHNEEAVKTVRSRGLTAYTSDEWRVIQDAYVEAFDGLLVAHVIEHMLPSDALSLIREHLTFVRPGGRIFFVCPQERGYASDPTHITYTTGADLAALAHSAGLEPAQPFSFPLPRMFGRSFTYNEFCLLANKPA